MPGSGSLGARHDAAPAGLCVSPPTRVRPARPAPVACAERWPLPGPVARSSKWRTRLPGGAGRVSHPHKGRGPCPSLAAASCDVTPWCTGCSSVTPEPPFGAPLFSAGGGESNGVGVCSRLVGGDCSQASLAVEEILGICPFEFGAKLLILELHGGSKVLINPPPFFFRCCENHR